MFVSSFLGQIIRVDLWLNKNCDLSELATANDNPCSVYSTVYIPLRIHWVPSNPKTKEPLLRVLILSRVSWHDEMAHDIIYSRCSNDNFRLFFFRFFFCTNKEKVNQPKWNDFRTFTLNPLLLRWQQTHAIVTALTHTSSSPAITTAFEFSKKKI